MKLKSRLFTATKTLLSAVSFLSLASIAAADAPYADANPFERSVFGDDWGVLSSDIFFGGAGAMFGLSPASRRLVFYTTDRAGDRVKREAAYVGTLRDLFDVALFDNIATFTGSGSSKMASPSAAAVATAQYWDGNGITAGAGATPNGTWDLATTLFWNTSAAGTNPTTGWVDGNDAFFSAGTDATGSYTVTVSGPVSANTITFEEGTITLAGTASPNLTLAAGLTVNNTLSGQVTLGSSLPISISATQSWTNTSTFLLSVASAISSSATTGIQTLTFTGTGTPGTTVSGIISNGTTGGTLAVSKTGPGTLTLSGTNTYSGGTTVSAGLLQLNSSSALGSSSGSLTVNGGILDLNGQNISVGNLTGAGGTIWNNGPNSGSSTVALTIGNGDTGGGTYAGVIQDNNGASTGKVAVTKTGTGTITLSGANTYTGLTTVTGGRLFINGNSSAATGAVNANSGGTTLGGNGITGGAVTVASGSNLSPGPTGVGSTAVFGTGALTLNDGSFFNVDLNNTTAGSGYDQVSVTGIVTVDGSNLVVTVGGVLSLNQKFFIVVNDNAPILDPVVGTFAQGVTVTSGSYTFLINYLDEFGSELPGNDISLTVTTVPEPSTWIGGALALAVVGFTQRRRLRGLIAPRA